MEVRNLRFEGRIPKYWHNGGRSVSTFLDGLSIFFPAGERFFINSVRAHEKFVTDPELRAQMHAFVEQEGLHTREHLRYNARLRAHGYPVDAMEKRVVNILDRVTRILPARLQLGVTCALEHFTAVMGQMVLSDPRILDGADETMAALWRWHAVEENEHRSVAFDVFLAARGTYAERAVTMLGVSIVFWAKVFEHQARLMHSNGTVTSGRDWAELGIHLFITPGGMVKLVRPYLAYYRPSFHPSEFDAEPLLARYRAALADLQAAA